MRRNYGLALSHPQVALTTQHGLTDMTEAELSMTQAEVYVPAEDHNIRPVLGGTTRGGGEVIITFIIGSVE